MNTSTLILVLSTFLACAVEAVEALTVVLAVGVTRGWRSAWLATAAGTATLVVIVAIFGPALARIPLDALRILVGALLLVFGMGWLRKAILRASGYKALRDEAALYEEEIAEAKKHGRAPGMDWYGFTLVFKAVFLEGLEVAFIVLTFGTSAGRIDLAALGAAIAIVIVVAVGIVVHKPLSRVPENTMKFAVGLMLSSFGTFWCVEGIGCEWPGSDLAILGVLAFMTACSWIFVAALRRMRLQRAAAPAAEMAN